MTAIAIVLLALCFLGILALILRAYHQPNKGKKDSNGE